MTPIRIKICCISTRDEAAMALDCGADALGLVSAMPSGPGVIDEALITEIATGIARSADTFLLTSLIDPAAIIAQHGRCLTSTIQLCRTISTDDAAVLRAALPGVRLVQVIHVEGEANIAEATEAARWADALLLDSGRPTATVPELGGTGRVHDWGLAARIVSAVPIPVWLAGGLKAENAAEAVRAVRPHGLDICSGVRRNGRLDDARLQKFIAAARSVQV